MLTAPWRHAPSQSNSGRDRDMGGGPAVAPERGGSGRAPAGSAVAWHATRPALTTAAGRGTGTALPAEPPTGSVRRAFGRRLRAGDLIIMVVVLALAMRVLWPAHLRITGSEPQLQTRMLTGALALLVWVTAMHRAEVYRRHLLGRGLSEYRRVAAASVLALTTAGLIGDWIGLRGLLTAVLVALGAGVPALEAWHWLCRRRLLRLEAQGAWAQTAYVVGSGEAVAQTIAELDRRPGLGLRVRGAFLADGQSLSAHSANRTVPVVGGLDAIHEEVAGQRDVAVVIAEGSGLNSRRVRDISRTLGRGSRIVVLPPLLDIAGSRLRFGCEAGMPSVEVRCPRPDVARSRVKRATDVLAATLLIVVLAPLWLVVPLLIVCDDRGPILFRQTRVGLGGEEFRILKFRTMRVNADAELERLLQEQNRIGRPLFKVDNDPRITRIGAFLRRTSIDELPQLFNVLDGSMSLVGPRPQVPKEVALYDARAARRLEAKPGITGMWQVNGRSGLSWQEAIRLDLFYVDNWTPGLDWSILVKTVKVVLSQEGSE